MPITIRPYEPKDWPLLWPVLHTTFAAGDTYAYAPESTEADVHKVWIETPAATYVAVAEDGSLLGTYKLQSNQPGLGSHVSNCGYVVAPSARGQGVASAMCEHSQVEAVKRGFKAMQFNLVVSTNAVAVNLWKKHGFSIVGTLPGAFQHRALGYVDAYVMFKTLGT
ncbi:N-acetyltransferase [Rhodoferax sp. GW822-FHT02A01]|uniref:GNAT family N-acetyltransferase n=1 Tax=Rhodoferax sp. GW822-FHT02A01 TaxID=3141537 RepID=UPI00315D88C5